MDERHCIDDPPDDVSVLARTTALELYDDSFVVLKAGRSSNVSHVRADRVTIATGSAERPLTFAGSDRPGIMLAMAAAIASNASVLVDDHPSLITTNALGGKALLDRLQDAGARSATIITRYEHLAVAAIPEEDTLLVSREAERRISGSGGRSAAPSLYERLECFVPDIGPTWLEVVGTRPAFGLPDQLSGWSPTASLHSTLSTFSGIRPSPTSRRRSEAGLTSVEHVKRATYIGTAIDQGRRAASSPPRS